MKTKTAAFVIGVLLLVSCDSAPQIDNPKTNDESEDIDTNITVTWKWYTRSTGENQIESGRYFIFNNKRYEKLLFASDSDSIKIDKAIATIVPENYQPKKDKKETLYSIKNCNDYSILTTGGSSSSVSFALYYDIEYRESMEKYYSNLDNYTLYFTLGEFENQKSCQLIQKTKLSIIEKLSNYKGTVTEIAWRERESEYNYINFFGISNDEIMLKPIMRIIKDGDNFYREEYSSITSTGSRIHATIFEEEQIALLLKLMTL